MSWKHIFARKNLEMLLAEMEGGERLHRVLGPIALTSLGVGCIIGAGIFVLTGVAAADDAGPSIVISFSIAAVGCALAALCYAEFAAMAPVAGSAYTYAYATLGEIFAWIIGWDLILEYAMGCATVASSWTKHLNELLGAVGLWRVPDYLSFDPFTSVEGLQGRPWCNLPSIFIMLAVTAVLVIGIRESARTNAFLVMIKVSVVLLVIVVGVYYVNPGNWTGIAVADRVLPQERVMEELVKDYCAELRSAKHVDELNRQLAAVYRVQWVRQEVRRLELDENLAGVLTNIVAQDAELDLPRSNVDRAIVEHLLPNARAAGKVAPDLVTTWLDRQFKANVAGQDEGEQHDKDAGKAKSWTEQLRKSLAATYRREWAEQEADRLTRAGRLSKQQADEMIALVLRKTEPDLPKTAIERAIAAELLPKVHETGKEKATGSWGLLGLMGLDRWLLPIDDGFRGPFAPYGLSGIMLGAAIVFFAFIGFDSISTHAEEARKPQRDVPIGILVSLFLCTALYIAVAAIITGMIPYPEIDTHAPIAVAFSHTANVEKSGFLRVVSGLVAAGGLAGMTSVLLVLFLSQARIFMAMSRDGLLPRVFGTVHPRFRTPHIATMLTGAVICVVAALTPIRKLAEMVNVGTLMAFVMVCAAVLILRIQRPDAHRPFRCPLVRVVAPLGMIVNLTLMLFLPLDTWLRLVVWLLIGMVIYFAYGRRHSLLTKHLQREIQLPGADETAKDRPAAGETSG